MVPSPPSESSSTLPTTILPLEKFDEIATTSDEDQRNFPQHASTGLLPESILSVAGNEPIRGPTQTQDQVATTYTQNADSEASTSESNVLQDITVSTTKEEMAAVLPHGPPGDPADELECPASLIDIEENNKYCIEVVPPEEISGGVCSKKSREPLQVGDHVYQWRKWMGIPGVFQHHGIVMDVQQVLDCENSHGGTNSTVKLIIADFSNVEDRSKKKKAEEKKPRRGGLTQEGILRTYADTDQWHKVHYKASWWQRSVFRAGTCTPVASDAVGLVLARVYYILRNPEVLPDYHVVNANCECVAVFCKTGRWSTLQASSILGLTTAGQAKSTATLAATAASTQVSVQAPAAGVWGWLGYTTTSQVSWLSIHPLFIPALAGYAVLSVGVPAALYVHARKQWRLTTARLNDSFWEDAMSNPEVFAECMTHWSDK